MTRLLTLGILFWTVARAVVPAKIVMLGISPLTSIVLALSLVLVAKLVISGILSSIFFILALYTSFLTASFFTTSLSLLKPVETGIYSTSNFSTLLFKLLKLVETVFSFSISNLSTLDFKLAKSSFLANFDVWTSVTVFKSAYVA